MQVKDGQNDAPVPAKKKRAPRPKRQDLGISRELYALMGDNAPPVTLALPKMKEKPRMQRKVQHWWASSLFCRLPFLSIFLPFLVSWNA